MSSQKSHEVPEQPATTGSLSFRRFLREWSPWHLRHDLAVAREDVRRFGVHLYACNVQRDWAEESLSKQERDRLHETWRREEASILAKAGEWYA